MAVQPDFITSDGLVIETIPKDDKLNERVKAYADKIADASDKKEV